jgi:hypothetical protein
MPNELWQRILGFATDEAINSGSKNDWIHLWVVCRQVSKVWRAAIAKIYLDDVLRYPGRCQVSYALGTLQLPDPEDPEFTNDCYVSFRMVYDRVSRDDKSRIVFKKEKPDPMDAIWKFS